LTDPTQALRRGELLCRERLADLLQEIAGKNWLRQKRQAFVETRADDHLLGISARIQNAYVRTFDRQPRREIASAQARHHDIGDQEIDRAGMAARNGERLVAVARFEYGVAVGRQDLP
jgi:hypothetical protein